MKLHLVRRVVGVVLLLLQLLCISADGDIADSTLEFDDAKGQDLVASESIQTDILSDSSTQIADIGLTDKEIPAAETATFESVPVPTHLVTSTENLNEAKPLESTDNEEVEEGPIILRPTPVPTMEPILVPAPRPINVSCPACGQMEVWNRRFPCPHCSVCGHAMIPQLRTSVYDKPPRLHPQDGHSPPSILEPLDPNQTPSNPELRGSLEGGPSQRYVAMHAYVNLDRKELLKRRLNYQRVKEYKKSIGAKEEDPPKLPPLSAVFQGAIKEHKLPDSNPDLPISNSSQNGTSALARTWAWLFGKDENKKEEKDNSKEGRSHSVVSGQPNAGFNKCPYLRHYTK